MKESRGITPLRTILQNCLNHIENLETNRSICDNYDKEFQDLKQFSETLKVQKEFSCTEGEKEVNRKKNRYKDILPFNVSRVVLSEYAGIPGSDYINANYIKGASGSPAYIASQGPLPNTVNDFWRMVVECEVQVIVMACNAQESGKHKCENYWVEKEGEEKRFGMVQICLVKASTVCPDFLVRTMRLKYTNDKDVTEERTVCQFHYSAWPDHGVPPLVRPLLDMVRLVRDTQASETLPVLVHCSAGCGRTGTICAIDFVWGLLRAGKLTEEFSLFNLVKEMRKQRVAMVQTKEQYILVHQAVRELFKEQLRVIESHPYENIDFNGVPLIKDFEEPFYDTICIQKDENCDEKQDKSEMKEKGEDPERSVIKIDPPPLPRKKRPNVLFSKQEKEAENLTEKNRSSFVDKEKEKEKTDASLSSLLGKPRIVKLRSLFEKSPAVKERNGLKDRGSQTVSRSHSLGAIRKPLTSEIFDSHVERKMSSASSQLTNTITNTSTAEPGKLKNSKSFSKSVPLIKRSKSLKTFTQSSHLCVSPPNAVERKSLKYHQPKSNEMDNHGSNDNEHSWQKTAPNCDLGQASGLARECSRRRRSLESLMGDYPPSITWPTVVMTVEKDSSNLKSRQKTSNWSPKLNSNTIQGSKTADILKHQLQRLSLETEKKMNSFVSGIGVRERRNSFRQAVSKSDFQTILRDYREHKSSNGKKPTGSENFLVHRDNLHSKVSKNSNEVSHPSDQPDCSGFVEREGLVQSKCVFDTKKYKLPDKSSLVGEQLNKMNSRHPSQPNSSGPSTSQLVLDSRLNKPVISSKSRIEECDKTGDYKNLFLKKLNSEMLSDRDGGNSLQQHNEARSRSNYEELDKPKITRFPSGSILGQSDAKISLFKTNINVKPTGSYVVNSDGLDEVDGSNGRFERSVEMESIPLTWQNSNVHSHQTYLKPQKPAKPFDCYKCYTTPMPAHSSLYNRTNPGYKVPTYQNSLVESNLRREEGPHEIRSKESFFPIPQKKNVCCVVPSKGPSNHESEISPFGSYRKNPGMSSSDLYVAINPEFDNNDKKLMLPSKMAASDKSSSKGFDCLPWSHSNSSRTSGEMNSSESSIQHSLIPESARLLGQCDASKSETKGNKKAEQGKGISKTRLSDSSSKITQSSQQCSSSSKQKKSEELKSSSSVEFCNRGIVNTSKVRQNVPKYSKDDFVLDEPTAPPRVKRHASVTVPRNNLNGSNRVSSWVSSEKKVVGERNSVPQVDKNAWSGATFGVDLDAVAASMQQEKREPTVLKEGIWSSKNHLSISNSSNVKKKQHYF